MIENEEQYTEALRAIWVQFWFNTVFYDAPNDRVAMSREDFMTLADMCEYVERGQ